MTKEQILEATEETLPRLAGEVLQPEKNKHMILNEYRTGAICSKCEKYLDWTRWDDECGPIDPIPITWDNAMKYRDWAVGEFDACEYHDALLAVFMHEMDYENDNYPPTSEFVHWLACEAHPIHYLQAAALCKIKPATNS